MSEYCLFPIPESVCFPGQTVPLHVFEPRYRKMIEYCLDKKIKIGVCHTKAVLHKKEDLNMPVKERLQKNQDTFEPQKIMGAGHVVLKKKLDDGRLLIEVEVDEKIEIEDITQQVPFYTARAKILETIELQEDDESIKAEIKNKLYEISKPLGESIIESLKKEIDSLNLAYLFVFAVTFTPINGDQKQELLEMSNLTERSLKLLKYLNELFPEPPPVNDEKKEINAEIIDLNQVKKLQ